MLGVNKVILVGRIGKDPEFKTTKHGISMVSFGLATNSKYKDRNGKTVNLTEWHNVQAYGKLAELLEKYAGKGSLLYVEGKLQTSRYQKNGATHSKTQVIITAMQFIKTVEPSEGTEEPSIGLEFQMGPEFEEDYMTDEEIPF